MEELIGLERELIEKLDWEKPIHRFFIKAYLISKFILITLWQSGIWLIKAAYTVVLLAAAIAVLVFCYDYAATIRPVLITQGLANGAIDKAKYEADKRIEAQKWHELDTKLKLTETSKPKSAELHK